jgi:predicted methyltransferase
MNSVHRFSILALVLLLGLPVLVSADRHGGGASLAERLASGDRPETDKKRDAGRKPAEVIVFLGVAPGMTVVDLIAAGGYYTEVLAEAVGGEGKVYAQNPPRVLKFRDGANDKAMTTRLEGNRLPNVQRLDQDVSEVALPPGSVDMAITALNFHDIYNGSGREAAESFLAHVKALLKPGGVLGLIDHSGAAGNDNTSLHRIEESKVLEVVRQSGFEVAATSDLLRNPEDDLSTQVFDPAIRGKTDRFVLMLQKPL